MRRTLLILATMVSSGLVGAGVALTGALRPVPQPIAQTPVAQTPIAQTPVSVAQTSLAPGATVVQTAIQPASQTVTPQAVPQTAPQAAPQVSEPLLLPPSPNPVIPVAASPNPVSPLQMQLQRAIRERNLTLLRSLLQAGSVREALRDIEVQQQISLDNLDASAWRVLEKAISYRCRSQPSDQSTGQQPNCFP